MIIIIKLGHLMTLDHIRLEMALIKELRKNDIAEARERWKALKERIESYCENNKIPGIWRKILLEEIHKV